MKRMTSLMGVCLLLLTMAYAQNPAATVGGLQRTGCNFINNNTFTAPAPPYDPGQGGNWGAPFNLGLVPDWIASHGDANIYDGVNYTDPPPFANAGYTRMAAGYNRADGNYSEGIAQTITPLQQGGNYAMSFFERMKKFTTSNVNVDQFNIYLMHSADAVNFNPNSYSIPPIPATAQRIYCEQAIANQNWKQVFFCFTANSNYDMIWIFPRCNTVSGNQPVGSNILFSYPEIISIDGFTAGSAPVPIQPNCTVDIGPVQPNCGVRNAVFSWFAPNDPGFSNPIAPSYAPPGQQLSVDASIPANTGTWTLRMTVPNAQKYGACGSNCLIQATVNVPRCSAGWPKVYQGKSPQYLGKDNAGNVFVYLHSASFANNVNHLGALPPTQNTGEYTVHYTSQGATNWAADGKRIQYCLNSGDAQLHDWTNLFSTQYVNSTTGAAAAPPAIVPAGQLIVAEAPNGSIITRDNASFYVHTPTTTTSVPVSAPYYVKFSPAINSLFVISVTSPTVLTFQKFNLQNNQLNPDVTAQLPNGSLQIVQVDDAGRLFVIQNGQLKQCDYTASPVGYNSLGISGLNNTALTAVWQHNAYTENRCLVLNQNDNYIYAVDLAGGSARKILSSGLGANATLAGYVFDGNNVYMAGTLANNSGITIGSQTISAVAAFDHSIFVTKFSLVNDFILRQAGNSLVQEAKPVVQAALAVGISPNPAAGNTLLLRINDPVAALWHRISIIDREGRVVRQKTTYTPAVEMNIAGLQAGIYAVVVTNNKGMSSTRMLMKE